MVAEAMWFGCGGYVVWLRRLCGVVAEAMWGGWLDQVKIRLTQPS